VPAGWTQNNQKREAMKKMPLPTMINVQKLAGTD